MERMYLSFTTEKRRVSHCESKRSWRPGTRLAATVASLAVACSLVPLMPALSPDLFQAAAEQYTANSSLTPEGESRELPAALKGDTEIEKLTDEYRKAQENVAVADAEAAKLQLEIDSIERILPDQQKRSDASIKQRYIMQTHPMETVDSLLASENMSSFLRQSEYLQRISKSNLEELNRTISMQVQLNASKTKLEQVIAEARAQSDAAHDALASVQEERVKKHGEAVEEARRQDSSGGAGIGDSSASNKQDESAEGNEAEAEAEAREASESEAAENGDADGETDDRNIALSGELDALDDGADWTLDRDEFITQWAERIDAYFEGTPLEGQGVNFAASAWKYCIDPRWSPAISNTESSKGQICIRPYNAWGWGAADSDPYGLALEWKSWEEAIDAHCAGLAKGYGYGISMSNALKYCPVNWHRWYNNTLGEMAKI